MTRCEGAAAPGPPKLLAKSRLAPTSDSSAASSSASRPHFSPTLWAASASLKSLCKPMITAVASIAAMVASGAESSRLPQAGTAFRARRRTAFEPATFSRRSLVRRRMLAPGMRIYLDVCCLNRPFDDQTQDRIRLEAEAVILILLRVHAGTLRWVSSEVVDHEVGLTPDSARRARVTLLAQSAGERVAVEDVDAQRGAELEALGFQAFDALHIACAERSAVDVFLTTDDKLVRLASRRSDRVRVSVKNPLAWILEEVAQ